MAKPNNPNGIVAERVIAKTVPKICLARYKEYFSVKKKRWNGAKNEQREKSWVATRRGRGESYFSTQPRLHHVFPALFSRKHEGWATIISPHLSSVLLFFALHPRGGVLFWFRNRILWISEEEAEGRAGRNGAKIETHRGERYKWDAVPRTHGSWRRTTRRWRRRRREKGGGGGGIDEETHRNNRRLEEVQEEGDCARAGKEQDSHSRDLNESLFLLSDLENLAELCHADSAN